MSQWNSNVENMSIWKEISSHTSDINPQHKVLENKWLEYDAIFDNGGKSSVALSTVFLYFSTVFLPTQWSSMTLSTVFLYFSTHNGIVWHCHLYFCISPLIMAQYGCIVTSKPSHSLLSSFGPIHPLMPSQLDAIIVFMHCPILAVSSALSSIFAQTPKGWP